jgi:hypothetical protein
MRAWFQVKGNATLEEMRIAVVVDIGELHFSLWSQRLGAPAAHYFSKDGSECRRQWIVRREANPLVFRALLRQLRGTKEGEVVEVVARMPARLKPEPEAA